MPEISIIVPVYKVARYLPRCIDSILAQTYTNFELLLIDDGSPDNSGKICDEYAEKDTRIRVIHKENGGVSSARNVGLEQAAGNYIMFCDSDDYVLPTWVSGLYSAVRQEGVCIGIAGLYYEKSNPYSISKRNLQFPPIVARSDFYGFRESSVDQYVVNKIFLKSTISNHSLRFDTNMVYGEDSVFVMNYLLAEEGDIGVCCEDSYAYVENSSSVSHNYIATLWDCYLTVFSLREKMLTQFGVDIDKNEKHYSWVLMWCINYSIHNYTASNCPLPLFQKLKRLRLITKSPFYSKALSTFKYEKYPALYKAIYRTKNPVLIYLSLAFNHIKYKIHSFFHRDTK